nr:WbuC family cupin fold metalloprotein [Bacteroidota bacterium]
MLTYNAENEEVLFCRESITRIDRTDVQKLITLAKANSRERIRLCTHHSTNESIHEMLIVHSKNTYVRPHKHLGKPESFHVIEGQADIVEFDEDGDVGDVIQMGNYASDRAFYYRISTALYHTLIIRTDVLVFHETTMGPFNRKDTVFASWSPEENDRVGIALFVKKLTLSAKKFLNMEANKS